MIKYFTIGIVAKLFLCMKQVSSWYEIRKSEIIKILQAFRQKWSIFVEEPEI